MGRSSMAFFHLPKTTARATPALTKQARDAILKTERALLLAVGSLVSHYVNNADRSVAAERSARFYGKCQR